MENILLFIIMFPFFLILVVYGLAGLYLMTIFPFVLINRLIRIKELKNVKNR